MRFPYIAGSVGSSLAEAPAPEPSYLDKLYIQFGQSMTNEQHSKFMQLTRERKDYLFDLWLKKQGYV